MFGFMLFLTFNIASAFAVSITELENYCKVESDISETCCSHLQVADIDSTLLLPYKADMSKFMVKKEAFSLSKPITNTIKFTTFEWDKNKVKVCGKIGLATSNYWGISGLWNSTWWNSSYPYCRNITIDNSLLDSDLTDFQFEYSITNHSNFAKSDFSDIVWLNDTYRNPNATVLNYWRKDYIVNTSTNGFVKIEKINANSLRNISFCYGCANCSDRSNKTTTLEFFDDFEDNDYTAKWEKIGSTVWVETSGKLTGTGDESNFIKSKFNLSDDFKAVIRAENTDSRQVKIFTHLTDNTHFYRSGFLNSGMDMYWFNNGYTSPDNTSLSTFTSADGILNLTVQEFKGYRRMLKEGTLVLAYNRTNQSGIGKIAFSSQSSYNISIYDIYVIKWAFPYPTSIIGIEESNITEPTPQPTIIGNYTEYISIFCSGNYSVRSINYSYGSNYSTNITNTYCDYGCNENNFLVNNSLCNFPTWLENLIFFFSVLIIIFILYKLSKWF